MKKFLSCCLVAVMLASVFAVGASALSWSAGAGFHAYEGENYANKSEIGPSPVEFTDKGNSVDVKQGGYYDGANINAGVRTNEAVGLDGLEVTVDFKNAPIATNDCWFAIHLMQKPELFDTGKMAENSGYVNLIRFGDPKLEMYPQNAWSSYGSSEIGANDNMFALKTGDKITMKVEYKYGQYVVTYDHNGKIYEVPTENTIQLSEEVFAEDGAAHVVVTGSLLGADSDWEYTVTVKEGRELSEEQKANAEFEKSKKVIADELESYKAQIESFKNVATSAVEGKVLDKETKASFLDFDEAMADLEDAIADLKEARYDIQVENAKMAAGVALSSARSASVAIEQSAQFLADEGEEEYDSYSDYDYDSDYDSVDVADEGYSVSYDYESPIDSLSGLIGKIVGLGFIGILLIILLVSLPIIIFIVVVIIVIVVIVKKKKKKNANQNIQNNTQNN